MTDSQKEAIKNNLYTFLEKVTEPSKKAGENMYSCPLCKSGTGKNGTGALKYYPETNTYTCFSCRSSGDIFKLVAEMNNLDCKADFQKVAEIAANTLNMSNTQPTQYTYKQHNTQKPKTPAAQKGGTKMDIKAYIAGCSAAVNKTDYFSRRGLTEETIARFRLGYDEAKELAIIPYDSEGSYYIGRNVMIAANSSGSNKHFKPKKEEAGEEPVFNAGAIQEAAETGTPFFICEAPLDAISIMQAGGLAVSLGGIGITKLKELLNTIDEADKLANLFAVVATDADKAGDEAAEKLIKVLTDKGITHSRLDLRGCKDVNELLTAKAGIFANVLEDAIQAVTEDRETRRKEALEEYNKTSTAARLDNFISLWDSNAGRAVPTGFKKLDKALDGGLYAGLYVIGAISSLGKTTYTLQIIDQIAEAGYDVCLFQLEMPAADLVAKSLSRLTAIISRTKRDEFKDALTMRSITSKDKRKDITNDKRATLKVAEDAYKAYAENIFIFEGIGDISAENVRSAVIKHTAIRGRAPVIVIDYAQIMAAANDRMTEKQAIDKNIVELKRMSRDFNTPVIAISSYNRGNYTSEANMAAFKESGAIEYTADVVLALQPVGMQAGDTKTAHSYNQDLIKKTTNNEKRVLEAVCLKNRNGKKFTLNYMYYALFNLYEEIEAEAKKDPKAPEETASTEAEDDSEEWEDFD